MDDDQVLEKLKTEIGNREVLLIAPGKSVDTEMEKVKSYIEEKNPVIIGVNAINCHYEYDYLFFINKTRYEYAEEVYTNLFNKTKKILISSIKTESETGEYIINFNRLVKRDWEHFDNAVVECLRLLDQLHIKNIAVAGFDGFKHKYNESYADAALPTLNPDNKWDELNEEIQDMFLNFKLTTETNLNIEFVTESLFNK